jgi:hypothetical protein
VNHSGIPWFERLLAPIGCKKQIENAGNNMNLNNLI